MVNGDGIAHILGLMDEKLPGLRVKTCTLNTCVLLCDVRTVKSRGAGGDLFSTQRTELRPKNEVSVRSP